MFGSHTDRWQYVILLSQACEGPRLSISPIYWKEGENNKPPDSKYVIKNDLPDIEIPNEFSVERSNASWFEYI